MPRPDVSSSCGHHDIMSFHRPRVRSDAARIHSGSGFGGSVTPSLRHQNRSSLRQGLARRSIRRRRHERRDACERSDNRSGCDEGPRPSSWIPLHMPALETPAPHAESLDRTSATSQPVALLCERGFSHRPAAARLATKHHHSASSGSSAPARPAPRRSNSRSR
jgi:hypothetical protein